MNRTTPEPMPTVPETGWRRAAIRLLANPDRAFMGLVDPNGEAWEAYFPLAKDCRPGTKAWDRFVKETAPERAAFSSYEHRLCKVSGEWWYAERFLLPSDGGTRSNLEVATGLDQRLRATDHWAQSLHRQTRA